MNSLHFRTESETPSGHVSQSEGLLEESDGAKVVFLEGFESRDGTSQPLLVKKSDGGFM